MNVTKLIIAAVASSLSFGAFAQSLDKQEVGTKISKHQKSAKNEVEKGKKLAKKGMHSKIS